jgi:hypothetical protein
MNINKVSIFTFQDITTTPAPKVGFKEYVENKEQHDAEVKCTLEKVQCELVELKALLDQIQAIKKKNVS